MVLFVKIQICQNKLQLWSCLFLKHVHPENSKHRSCGSSFNWNCVVLILTRLVLVETGISRVAGWQKSPSEIHIRTCTHMQQSLSRIGLWKMQTWRTLLHCWEAISWQQKEARTINPPKIPQKKPFPHISSKSRYFQRLNNTEKAVS